MPYTRTLIALSVLTAFGYLGNMASLPVAFSVSFLFGSIFVIIAVSLFGPMLGGLTALIASSYTYIFWNHPYAIIIFVCEALWMGYFLKRKHINIVLIDAAYWLVIGLPLVFIFYFGVMSLGFQSATIIFMKQAINGIANALIAGILITYLPLRKWFGLSSERSNVPFSQVIFQLTSAFLMLPLLGMLLFTNYQEAKIIQTMAGELLVAESKETNELVSSWLERHIVAVKTIAKLGRENNFQSSGRLQANLEQINLLFPDLHNVFVGNKKATTVAFFPAINEKGESTIGINFSDREWFKQLNSTLKPVISDVFQGRGGVFSPIFSISVPIVVEGELAGFGLGAVNLDKMRNLLVQSSHNNNIFFTVVDRQNNIVCSTNPGNQSLKPLKQKSEGQTMLIGKGFSLWTPSTKKNISVMDVWKDASYSVDLPIAGTTWTLMTELPIAPLQKYLYQQTIMNLFLIFSLFVAAIFVSQIVSKLLARTPVRLAEISRDIPDKLEKSAEMKWPASNIAEMHLLAENFKQTTQALSLQYQNIKNTNIYLEEKVQERTVAIQESENALRRSEEQMLMAEKIGRTGSWVYNIETNKIWGSAEGLRIFGYPPVAGDWPIDNIEDCIPERERVHQALVALISEGRDYNLEYAINPADGSPSKVIHSIAKLEKDAQGTTLKVSGFLQDITERRQMEADKLKLETHNRQLQKSESLGRMAGAIAHHFNNQLGAVIGNLEMAMDELPKGASTHQTLTKAMQSAWKSADMSSLMLTYLGQTHEKVEPLDLSYSCRKILPLLKEAIPANVIMETDFQLPRPIIMANAGEMQQILTNLITNAWEAIGNNKGNISLNVKTVSPAEITTKNRFPVDWQHQDKAYDCMEVTDTGSGIENKDIEKLFDPFFSTKFTGRGMGLAVVLGLANSYKGVITVESKPGKGSTFRIFFPVSEEPLQQPQTAENDRDVTTGSPSPRKMEEGGTVLLVEDEEMLRDMAAAMLGSFGFTVLKAKDGIEALEIFGKHQSEIKFVLTDLTMPRMNGWETLTALRKLKPNIPVILASGYDLAHVMEGDHPELPQAFLAKPYNLKALRAAVSQTLEIKKLRDRK